MKKLITILAAAIAMGAAAIETSIAYQGVLRDALGSVLASKSQTITFRLYSQPSGGTPLWGRTIAVNLDDTGLFNVELNDTGTPADGATYANLADALAAVRNSSLYVGLFVADSAGEIAPRQKIMMTPYSSWAADVTNASGDLRLLGVVKAQNAEGRYVYMLPNNQAYRNVSDSHVTVMAMNRLGALSIKFSGNMAVVRTLPGHASHVAGDIDLAELPCILGTVAGDDTVMVVLEENADRAEVLDALSQVLPMGPNEN